MNSPDEIRARVGDILGMPPEEIDDDINLIEMGLDSIRIMTIAGEWQQSGHELNFADLAAEPTIDAWAAMLASTTPDSAAQATTPPAESPDADTSGDESFGLAPMQHAYWVGRTEAAELGGVAAHLYVEFDGASDIDPRRLGDAVRALAEVHPMLRAQFQPDGTQRVLPALRHDPFQLNDLRGLPTDDIDLELARIRESKSHQMLDVANGQVFDMTLSLLPDGRHRLHFDIDMLAADAMSYRMLLADLVRLYNGDTVAAPDYTYRDYLQHRSTHPSPAGDRDRAWWRGRIDELPSAPALPTRVDGSVIDHRVIRHHHWIDAEAKAELLAAAHERGVTPAIALAGAFAATIGAWSSQDRFLLNVPLFHRNPVHPDIDRVSGDFSSSILLDVDLRHAQSLLDLIRSMQKTMHANGAHSSYGALDVLRDLGRARGEPVFAPVVYTSALGLGELFADDVRDRLGEPVWTISQGPQVVLDAQITEVDGGLLVNWDVRESAFPPGVIDAMFAHYVSAVDSLRTGDAGWLASATPALPAAQRAVRQRVNDTAGPVSGRVLHEEFFSRATHEPDRTALIWQSGALSYGALAAEAYAIAGALRAAAVLPGDAVAVQVPKGHEQVIATLGVFAAGAVWVPIGHDQPRVRRDTILRTGDVRVLLGADLTDDAPDGVRTLDLADARDHRTPFAEPIIGDPESVAYVLFTSGSTGTPKGVEVPHRAAMNTIDDINDRFDVGADDRSLTVAALEFDISVYDIFGIYSAGGAVIAVDAASAKDPNAWLDLLRAHRASILTCVPSAFDMLLTVAESDPRGLGNYLRAALLGGDWVGVDLPRRMHALAPDARFAGLGGATEIAIHGTVCEVLDPPAHWTSVPFGTPLRNVECRVVDSSDRDCPDWVTGELWVGGAGVACGYRNDPVRTAESFGEENGTQWYRTGDLARYWPDGTIEFVGRADHQVKIRGFRVELGEVEGALRAVDGVHHAVATVTEEANGARRLVAAVTGEPDRPLEAATVLNALAEQLPAYMVPTHIEVVATLPLTDNGKLDRVAVDRLFVDRTRAETVSPADDLERALLDIVGDVLSADPGSIGVTDDFFAVGGDSVLATRVIARIREWLDAPQVGIVDIFAARTVRDLAIRLDAGDETPGRLAAVAAVYLDIASMDDEALAEASEANN